MTGQRTAGAVAMIAIGENVSARELAPYVAALRQSNLLARCDGRYVFNAKPLEMLEGDPGPRRLTLMSRFPSREAFDRFWSSPDYQQHIKPLRAHVGQLDIGVWRLRTSEAVPGAAAAFPCPPGAAPVHLFATATGVDRARWNDYAAAVHASGIVTRHGGNPIVFGPALACVEGRLPDITIVITFPCIEAVRAFWHSHEYRSIAKLREGAGRLIAGIWPSFG